MTIAHHPAPHAMRHHRRLQHLSDLEKGLSGINHPATANDQWSFGKTEQLRRFGYQIRIGLRRGPVFAWWDYVYQAVASQHIHGHFELDRFRDPRGKLEKRFTHE